MIVKIENTTRTIPVIVAKIPISLIGAEELMLSAVPDIVQHMQQPHAVYNVEFALYKGAVPHGLRHTIYLIETDKLGERLEQAIKGHPDGYPAGPWPIAADVTSETTEVRITLIEV